MRASFASTTALEPKNNAKNHPKRNIAAAVRAVSHSTSAPVVFFVADPCSRNPDTRSDTATTKRHLGPSRPYGDTCPSLAKIQGDSWRNLNSSIKSKPHYRKLHALMSHFALSVFCSSSGNFVKNFKPVASSTSATARAYDLTCFCDDLLGTIKPIIL